MNTLAKAALYVIIFLVAIWLIGILPIPVGLMMLRTVLYILAGLALIAGLYRLAK